ncbi:TPA: hypothetical protein SMF43_001516 [Serratia marcescens]|nr:hypothetical protein [Serratia marcescens]
MDNKLSELSKPVAWADERGNLCTVSSKIRGFESRYRQDYEKFSTPIYSQEYVSALIKRAEGAEAFRDQMLKYVRTLGSSAISPSVVETILSAAERSKGGK